MTGLGAPRRACGVVHMGVVLFMKNGGVLCDWRM
jgi:hypothetical protein